MPSESLTWQLCPVVRASFHAVLHSGIDAVSLAAAMQEFSQTVEGLRQAHQLLTASLFRYQAHLFLYLESVGTALAPDGLSPLLDAMLSEWPAAVGGKFSPALGQDAAIFLPRCSHNRRRLAA